MTLLLLIFGVCILAGLTQSVTGFGAAIVIMMFAPYFMTITEGAAMSSLILVAFQVSMLYTYRKYLRLDYVLKPLPVYMVVSTVCISIAAGKDMSILKLIFGLFLIALSIYFLFISARLKVRASWTSAMVCGTVSGAAAGFFGISGPPMVIYFMALTGEDKMVYLASTQLFFFLTNTFNTVVRIYKGIITQAMIPLVIAGVCGILIGKTIGTKIVSRINAEQLKKVIYIVLALSGVINVVSCLK